MTVLHADEFSALMQQRQDAQVVAWLDNPHADSLWISSIAQFETMVRFSSERTSHLHVCGWLDSAGPASRIARHQVPMLNLQTASMAVHTRSRHKCPR